MEIFVTIESHPRSDSKILNILKDNCKEAYYSGGVGQGGWRVIIVEHDNIDDVRDLLENNKYVLDIVNMED